MPISFGTEGWRGVIAQDFTNANVYLVARAIARYLRQGIGNREEGIGVKGQETGNREQGTEKVFPYSLFPNPQSLLLVGYDTRQGSPEFAQVAAGALMEEGFQVQLAPRPLPSPLLSFAVKHFQARGGIMITASHNPPQYNGLKFKDHFGGSASPLVTDAIERGIQILQQQPTQESFYPPEQNEGSGEGFKVSKFQGSKVLTLKPETLKPWNFFSPYYQHVQDLVDFKSLRKSGLTVVVDPMHGAGSGWMKKILASSGLKIIEIAAKKDPLFGGRNPEPIEENLRPLMEKIKKIPGRKKLGLALDGDADRLGAVDEQGRFVNSHQIFALLLQHLVKNKGWRGTVVKTFSTTDMIDKLCQELGLSLKIVPIGFKHICQLMLEEEVLMGGEESGGLGFTHHIPERDGLLAGLLLLEALALEGKTLGQAVEELSRKVGPHAYLRWDLPWSSPPAGQQALARLKTAPPEALGGYRVDKYEDLDGLKLRFNRGGWLLFRASGTEPVLRLYAEGPDLLTVKSWLEEGKKLIEGRRQKTEGRKI